MSSYRSLLRPTRHELPRIQGSRFLGWAAPAAREADARELVEQARAAHPAATHHCWAWRSDRPGVHRCSDDGEPRNSAGPPILRRIEGAELHAAAVVVIRYYGGTKLGVGGLVRAYGGCAAATLDRAEVGIVQSRQALRLRYAYADQGAVEALLGRHDAQEQAARYTERIEQVLLVVEEEVDALRRSLANATAGRAELELL